MYSTEKKLSQETYHHLSPSLAAAIVEVLFLYKKKEEKVKRTCFLTKKEGNSKKSFQESYHDN